jgi:signal transduction histidine kinase
MSTQADFYSQLRAKPPVWRYGLAVLFITSGALLARLLYPAIGNYGVRLPLLPAVALASWFCGLGPSLLSVGVGILVNLWLSGPGTAITGERVLSLIAFLIGSGLIVVMGEASHRRNDALRNGQGELEQNVRERTAELDVANRSLRDLTARLMQLQDEERRRIARELHDSVGQMLAGLSMNLASLHSDIERLAKARATLTDSEDLVQEMSKEVRTMSHLLHPPLLDEAGLSSALRWYVQGFTERSEIAVTLELPEDLGRLNPELETAIFRTVQECLTNVHRHSGSESATVHLVNSKDELRIEVRDNGDGIPPEKHAEIMTAGPTGVGIRGMRERIRQLGGNLEIESKGKGTLVVARLPINKASSGVAA